MSDYCLYPNLCGIGVDCSGCLSKEITRLQSEVERLRGRCGESEARLNQINNLVAMRWGNGVPTNSEMLEEVQQLSKSGTGSAWLLIKQAEALESVVGECEGFDQVWDRAQDLRQQAAESESGTITRKAD